MSMLDKLWNWYIARKLDSVQPEVGEQWTEFYELMPTSGGWYVWDLSGSGSFVRRSGEVSPTLFSYVTALDYVVHAPFPTEGLEVCSL